MGITNTGNKAPDQAHVVLLWQLCADHAADGHQDAVHNHNPAGSKTREPYHDLHSAPHKLMPIVDDRIVQPHQAHGRGAAAASDTTLATGDSVQELPS